MQIHRTAVVALLAPAFLFACGAAGCASGPLAPLAFLNPQLRKQWREDEQYGTMFKQRVDALDALQRQLPKMDEADQERTTQQLAELVQKDPNPLIRRRATLALGEAPGPLSDPGLMAASADTDPTVRVAACQSWAARRDATGMQALIRALGQDEDADVKMAAARGLGQYQDPAAITALGEALDAADPALQVRAMESLTRVSGQKLGRDVRAWRQYVQSGEVPARPPVSFAERLGLPSLR